MDGITLMLLKSLAIFYHKRCKEKYGTKSKTN